MADSLATLGERALRRLGVAVIPLADRPALTAAIPAATLATAALVELGVIASDETPSASDQALALSKLLAMHEALAAQALVWWTDTNVPRGVSEEYIKLTTLALASSFGKPTDAKYVEFLEARVRRMALVLSAPTIADDAMQGVHNDLVQRGAARWSVWDIPEGVGDAYVILGANAMAADFGRPRDPADDIAAERAIARYIALPPSGERTPAEYF